MQHPVQQSQASSPATPPVLAAAPTRSKRNELWDALVQLDFISKFFSWTMELLARVTEPLASLSAIYIIIVAGVPALHNDHLYVLSLALIIGSPELLVVGAFKIASHEIAQGNKKGWWLMMSCFILLVLTALTVADLFMWHWDQTVVNILLGFRCLAGITYAFTRGIVTDHAGSLYSGSQVHASLEEMSSVILEQVRQCSLVNLAEVNALRQETRNEVHHLLSEVNQQCLGLRAMVNQFSQDQCASVEDLIGELGEKQEQVLIDAVERLERANSHRLEAVYSRLEQVKVTLESNPVLPTVHPTKPRLHLPKRTVHAGGVNQQHQMSEPEDTLRVNDLSEPGDGFQDSKLDQGRTFTVNHFRESGSLPTLTMIMSSVYCSKTLASRAYNLAKQDLGIHPGAGE